MAKRAGKAIQFAGFTVFNIGSIACAVVIAAARRAGTTDAVVCIVADLGNPFPAGIGVGVAAMATSRGARTFLRVFIALVGTDVTGAFAHAKAYAAGIRLSGALAFQPVIAAIVISHAIKGRENIGTIVQVNGGVAIIVANADVQVGAALARTAMLVQEALDTFGIIEAIRLWSGAALDDVLRFFAGILPV